MMNMPPRRPRGVWSGRYAERSICRHSRTGRIQRLIRRRSPKSAPHQRDASTRV